MAFFNSARSLQSAALNPAWLSAFRPAAVWVPSFGPTRLWVPGGFRNAIDGSAGYTVRGALTGLGSSGTAARSWDIGSNPPGPPIAFGAIFWPDTLYPPGGSYAVCIGDGQQGSGGNYGVIGTGLNGSGIGTIDSGLRVTPGDTDGRILTVAPEKRIHVCAHVIRSLSANSQFQYLNGQVRADTGGSPYGGTGNDLRYFTVAGFKRWTDAISNPFIGGVIAAWLSWRDPGHAALMSWSTNPSWMFAEPVRRVWISLAGGGSVYDVAVAEASSMLDAALAFGAFQRSAAEAASSSDSPNAVAAKPASAAEAGSAADSQAAASSRAGQATEPASSGDAQTASAVRPSATTEVATATEQQSSTAARVAALTEAATASDAATWGAAAVDVSVAEGASALDAIVRSIVAAATAAETAVAADFLSATAVRLAISSESAVAADAANWGGALYSVEALEAATAADAFQRNLQGVALALEALAAADAPSAVAVRLATATEAAVAVDLVAGSVPATIAAALSEAATAGEILVAFVDGTVYVATAWSYAVQPFGKPFRVVAFGKAIRPR